MTPLLLFLVWGGGDPIVQRLDVSWGLPLGWKVGLPSHPRQAGSAPLEKATVGPPSAAHVSAPWEGRGGFLGDVSLKAAASRPELDATYFQPASGLDHAGVSCYRTWTQKSQGLLSVSKQSQKGFP